MATAKKLTDNHLTCVICMEVFTDPATLQCNHTFCKSCLMKYTKTQPEAMQAKSIPCPSCRQQTKVTNPGCPVEKWVSHLKPSHVIQGLMDDLGGSPGVDACSVCKDDGKTTPGTMWCATCEEVFCDGCLKLHKRMPFLRDHEVTDLRVHSNWKPKLRSFMCRIHVDEKIKLFCKDCRMAMCTVCCSIKHRKCDDVETIDAMIPVVKEALVNETRIQENKIQTYIDNISSTKSKIGKLTSSAQAMKNEVRKVRMAATDFLMRKEKELLDRIDKLTESRVEELKAYRKCQEIDLQVEQHRHEFTDKAVASDCVADMFGMYESVNASRDEDARVDKGPQISRIVFTKDTKKLMKSLVDVQLGKVEEIKGIEDRTLCPVLLEEIVFDCRDYPFCCLNDIAVLTVDGTKITVVSEHCFHSLRVLYSSNKKSFRKCLPLSSVARQIAKVGKTKAAVTLPATKEIAFIKFDPDPSLESTIRTWRQYFGLACLNSSQLLAGSNERRASVDILDMEGNVLKSINTGVIKNPHFIHVTRGNNVLVSDETVKSLVSVTIEGQTVFTLIPRGQMTLEHPQGITTTSTGDILLLDRDCNKVIQLTETGQFVRYVLTAQDGLCHPLGICLDDDGLLYVTSSRNIKVFGCV